MKKALLMCLMVLSATAIAAPVDGAPAAECEGLKVGTGPKGKGYSSMFADIDKVCGRKVALCEVNTDGGLDNLTSLSTKDVDLGFAMVDTFNAMKAGDDNIAALTNVHGTNFNFMHIVVNANGMTATKDKRMAGIKFGSDVSVVYIQSFTDLRGKPVALVGTAALMGRQLNKQLGMDMQFVDVKSDAEAFDMVKKGTVAAAFSVSGWPSGPIKALNTSSGLTLVPFNAAVGDPFKVKALNYKNLAVYNVNTVGVQNALFSRPFSGSRAAQVDALQSCIKANLNELKEGNFQPGWNEIKGPEVQGVPLFKKSGK